MPSVMTRQRFVKSIGVFPGPRETFLKTHLVLKELMSNDYYVVPTVHPHIIRSIRVFKLIEAIHFKVKQ